MLETFSEVAELLKMLPDCPDWQETFQAIVDCYQRIRDEDGRTLLHEFARNGTLGQVEVILKHIEPTVTDQFGNPPLSEALYNDQNETVIAKLIKIDEGYAQFKKILSRIVNVDRYIDRLLSAFCQQVEQDPQSFDQVMNVLNSLVITCMEKTCCHVGCELFRRIVCQCQNVRDLLSGRTLLHVFAAQNSYKAVGILLRYFSPNVEDQLGCTPLFEAVNSNCPDNVHLLLEAGADVCKTCLGSNIFHQAARKNWRITKILLDCLEKGVVDESAHRATGQKSGQPIQTLGYLLKQKDAMGKTPIELAIEYDCVPLVMLYEIYNCLPPEKYAVKWHLLGRDKVIRDFFEQTLCKSKYVQNIQPQIDAWTKRRLSFWLGENEGGAKQFCEEVGAEAGTSLKRSETCGDLTMTS
jgi:ankyrin repeat protein